MPVLKTKAVVVCIMTLLLAAAFVELSSAQTAGTATRKVNEVELLLSRPKFLYSSLGNRDPFMSLVSGEFHGEGIIGLISVGDMELVGILWGSKERLAMVEDSRGRGYVLRVGDAVLDGVVKDITTDSIVIAQTFYGETQTVIIKMTRKEGERNEKK
jgi:Tfp pilus assembly protein PilP